MPDLCEVMSDSPQLVVWLGSESVGLEEGAEDGISVAHGLAPRIGHDAAV